MVTELRIYAEGGGKESGGKRKLQEGMNHLLQELRESLRQRRVRWALILCGDRAEAFDQFCAARRAHPEAHCLLLVDAEEAIRCSSAWEHVKQRRGDGWERPPWADDGHIHFMAQVMETWFLADLEALREFYGEGFRDKSIPRQQNLEEVDKPRIYQVLRDCSSQTRRGEYHKIHHASELLKRVSLDKVCARAPHARRLVEAIRQL